MASESTPLLLSPTKPLDVSRSTGTLWSPKAAYVLSNMGLSAYSNYLAVLYADTSHFSKLQIGVLQALPCLCTVVGAPFWCALADKYERHRFVHVLSVALGALLVYVVSLSRSFPVTLTLVLLTNFVGAPSAALLDHAVLDLVATSGGEYGKQRLFASIGYGAGAYAAGLAVAVGGIAWAFNVSVAFTLSSLIALHYIPVPQHRHAGDKPADPVGGVGVGGPLPQVRDSSFSQAMRHLAKKGDVLMLLGVVFIMGLMYGVLTSFLALNLYDLSGQNAQIIGIAIMCETASEVPAFFFSQRIIDALGTVNVLLLATAGYAARITFYAFMTNAWSAIPFEFLNGLSYGIVVAAVTEYLYDATPRGTEGTAIGLLNAVLDGAGRGGGTLIGGYFYQHYGAQTMWLVTDLGVPLSLVGIAVFAHLRGKAQRVETVEAALA